MKKTIMTSVCALLLVLLCVGCFGKKDGNTQQARSTKDHTAIILVDLQNDFTMVNNGTLPVGVAYKGTDQNLNKDSKHHSDQAYIDYVVSAQKFFKQQGFYTIATMDWHGEGSKTFASNHVDVEEYGDIKYDNGKPGKAWPDHCVKNTDGAKIVKELAGLYDETVKKGKDDSCECYSGFKDDNNAETKLDSVLQDLKAEKVYVSGLALDYCVAETAKHAKEKGYDVTVVVDLCRSVDEKTEAAQREEMERLGIRLMNFADLKKEILGT